MNKLPCLSAALLAGAALVLTACGPATSTPTAGSPTTQSTPATPPTTQSSSSNPGSATVWEIGGWRETNFRVQTTGSGMSTSSTLLMDVTNLQQTTRSQDFVISLGRVASGATVTSTGAMAVNVAPGKTVTVSGPAAIAVSPSLDVNNGDFFWDVQTVQG